MNPKDLDVNGDILVILRYIFLFCCHMSLLVGWLFRLMLLIFFKA